MKKQYKNDLEARLERFTKDKYRSVQSERGSKAVIYTRVSSLEQKEKNGSLEVQMKYCQNYEKNLWGYIAATNRLYENNLKTIGELTSDGPFTSAISKECPPRIAMWVGWQIVRSYMKNNESVSIEQLLDEKDAQKILNKSKYRP